MAEVMFIDWCYIVTQRTRNTQCRAACMLLLRSSSTRCGKI